MTNRTIKRNLDKKWKCASGYTNINTNQMPYAYTVELRNRFKALDLIDRVPDELWTEVRDIVQEIGIKTIPRKRNAKKTKWLSRRPYKSL